MYHDCVIMFMDVYDIMIVLLCVCGYVYVITVTFMLL